MMILGVKSIWTQDADLVHGKDRENGARSVSVGVVNSLGFHLRWQGLRALGFLHSQLLLRLLLLWRHLSYSHRSPRTLARSRVGPQTPKREQLRQHTQRLCTA